MNKPLGRYTVLSPYHSYSCDSAGGGLRQVWLALCSFRVALGVMLTENYDF